MNAKIDSDRPPHVKKQDEKEKKATIVNRLTCATLEGVNAQGKKIARAIVDLNEHESIKRSDIFESLSYRRR